MIEVSSRFLNNIQVNKFLKQIPEQFENVLDDSINKTIAQIRREARKDTPKVWDVPKEELSESKIRRSGKQAGEFSAQFLLNKKRIPLIRMGATPGNIMSGKTSGGVSVLIAGQRHAFKRVFVGNFGRGKGVYQRTGKFFELSGKKREAVKQITTANVAQMTRSEIKGVPDILQKKASEIFEETFIRECESRLIAMGAK